MLPSLVDKVVKFFHVMQILRFNKTLVLLSLKLNLFYPWFIFLIVYLENSCTNKENDIINLGISSFRSYMLTKTEGL